MNVPFEILAVARQLGRARGFRNDMTEEAPLCRMVLPGANRSGGNLPVDFMPLDPVVLGFSNVWYPNAYARAQRLELATGLRPLTLAERKMQRYSNPSAGAVR